MACFESRLARPSRWDGRQEEELSKFGLAQAGPLESAGVRLPRAEAERWTAEEVLRWGFDRFSPDIAIASAFGAEGMVLIDLASSLRSNFRVFTLDTGFFFPETYELIEKVERRYGISVERCRPELTPADQERVHGPALWARDPDRCCALRKVEPLETKLRQLTAWVSAIRREQTAARAASFKIEWDTKFELVKLNPLADWTSDEVWTYIRSHGVPYNPLHDRNYPSIGCTHCTRAVRAGEDARAGRWAGFQKTECGLHTRASGGDAGSAMPNTG
jgi:phosphoadenosine phosphosulfate reductase